MRKRKLDRTKVSIKLNRYKRHIFAGCKDADDVDRAIQKGAAELLKQLARTESPLWRYLRA